VIKTFLFDMGNVLVYFSHDLMCEQMGALCGKTGPEIRELLIDSGLQWEFERGRMSPQEFCNRFENEVNYRVQLDKLLHAGSDIFTLNEPIVPILDSLKSLGHRLVLLSNTSVAHFKFVSQNYDVLGRFDDFVVSYKVGAVKPEPEIFQAALNAIDCQPDECFYTDDIAEYVQLGRQNGLQAEVFTDTENLVDQLRQRDIHVR